MAEQTKKRLMTTDNETETEVMSKNTPAIIDYAIGAVKENEMKILDIITLTSLSLLWFARHCGL